MRIALLQVLEGQGGERASGRGGIAPYQHPRTIQGFVEEKVIRSA